VASATPVNLNVAAFGAAKQASILQWSFALWVGAVQTLHMEVLHYPLGASCFIEQFSYWEFHSITLPLLSLLCTMFIHEPNVKRFMISSFFTA
jgi:hypothetical protein